VRITQEEAKYKASRHDTASSHLREYYEYEAGIKDTMMWRSGMDVGRIGADKGNSDALDLNKKVTAHLSKYSATPSGEQLGKHNQ